MKEATEVPSKRKLSYKKNAGTDFFPNRSTLDPASAGLPHHHRHHPLPIDYQPFDRSLNYPQYLHNRGPNSTPSPPFSGHYGYCITSYTRLSYGLTGQEESLAIEFFTLPGKE